MKTLLTTVYALAVSSYQHESAVVYMIMEQIDVGLIHTS